MKRIVLIFLSSAFFSVAYSQMDEIGVFGGVSYYAGDLNPIVPFKMPHAAYGIVYRHNFNSRLAVLGSVTHSKLAGSDAISKFIPERDLYFSSNLNEISIRGEYNYLNFLIGSSKNYYSTFLFGGVGGFIFNPLAKDGTPLRTVFTERADTTFITVNGSPDTLLDPIYSKYSAALVFGIGFKYSPLKKLGITLEWGMRKTLTDYLDDVSTTYGYIKGKNLYSDPTSNYNKGDQRGNSETNDWYSFAGVSITYKFSLESRNKCRNNEF
jgi:hypothetical protein